MGEKKAKKIDQALILGENDGEVGIVRFRQDEEGRRSVESGTVRSTDKMTTEEMEGREIINLKKREGSPLRDVVVIREGTGHKGPARVTSQAFRDNYDSIFDSDDVPENVTWN